MIRGLWVWLLLLSGTVQAQQADFENVDFHRADSIAALYKGEGLKNLPILAHKLTAPLSSKPEQFRAIYTWVSTNIDNDYWAYLKNKKKRKKLQHDSLALAKWNASFRLKAFKKLAEEQKTVCTGYAYLVSELAALAAINCKIIDGYGRTANVNTDELWVPNHSWNAVQLNNKWYLCDATWSSGIFDVQENTFIRDYNDGYFLADPELFVMNHYPLDTTWILLHNKPELTEFLKAPLIYKHAFNYPIIPIAPKVMHIQIDSNNSVTFLVKAPDSIKTNDINIELASGAISRIVKPDITRTEEGLLALTHRFERWGHYDVHLKVAEHYIVTYTVRVKKNKR